MGYPETDRIGRICVASWPSLERFVSPVSYTSGVSIVVWVAAMVAGTAAIVWAQRNSRSTWRMKVKQNAGQLRLRGLVGAQGEFTLHALCHNLRKLANHTQPAIC